MKILFVINQLHSGGAEQQLVALCEGLVARGHHAHVISIYDQLELRDRLDRIRVPITVAHKYNKLDLTIVWRLYRLIKQLKPELIHAYLPASCLFAGLVKWLGAAPPLIHSERSITTWKTKWRIYLDQFARAKAAAIVCNAEAIRSHLSRNEKVPLDKIAVVYNGLVSERRTRPPNDLIESARKRVAAPKDAFVLVALANFVSEKQHDVMLKAFALATAETPQLFLLLVGKGELEPDICALITRLNLANSTYIVRDCLDPRPLLCVGDAAILTSCVEGCSNALLEAMAMGLPIIATNAGGNPEIVVDGRGGIICEVGDVDSIAAGICRLARDASLRQCMGRYNKSKVACQFTDDVLVQKTLEIYQRALD